MLEKLFSDKKNYRIFTIIMIIILFILILKKYKENFTFDISTPEKFEEKVINALGDNFVAIKNLSELANNISSSENYLTLDKFTLKYKNQNIDVGDFLKNMENNLQNNYYNKSKIDSMMKNKVDRGTGRR